MLDAREIAIIQTRYAEYVRQFGPTEQGVGWGPKGRQAQRFEVLTSYWNLNQARIIDIGCGFADLRLFLSTKSIPISTYVGVDLVPELIEVAALNVATTSASLVCGDFLAIDRDVLGPADFVFGSGIFNFKLSFSDNLDYIIQTLEKAFQISEVGCAFNFLTNRVDYELPQTFHTDPSWVLNQAFKLTKRVMLRNDYFPFEFSVFLSKNDNFEPERGVFSPESRLSGHA